MKKLLYLLLAVSLIGGMSLPSVSYADVHIDEGQFKSTAPIKFFIGRYGRTGDIGVNGGFEISIGHVVIWDTASNDGVSIHTTTKSADPLVAGVALDVILGSSRDFSAVSDDAFGNWGRIQVWGKFTDVSYDNNQLALLVAGLRVGSGSSAGTSSIFRTTSLDATAGSFTASSQDSFGVSLEAATDNQLDIFINKG